MEPQKTVNSQSNPEGGKIRKLRIELVFYPDDRETEEKVDYFR